MPVGEFLQISPEVKAALANRAAVVALESTVIAHGLPQPQNLETALRLEAIVREQGAEPATIAVLDGRLCVGLEDGQIALLAGSANVKKLSVRDLPVAVGQRLTGATTVASSIWIAKRAGINVFATGGIGGVHRGDDRDISADLPELARTPIVVVCSGAKIVLNLSATREWLETYGVTVLGYGCDEMPAFYSRSSGLGVDAVVESATEVVRLAKVRDALGIQSALLVTNPIPPNEEISQEIMEAVLTDALSSAEEKRVTGARLTPFLLSQMGEQSDGATLRANISLLENNARVAAEIAVEMSKDQ